MKVSKLMMKCLIVTVVAMLYVHQRIEITKECYRIQEARKQLSCLVGKNSKLMYDLAKLESPKHLLGTFRDKDMIFAGNSAKRPRSYNVAYAEMVYNARGTSLVERFMDIFTPAAEARPRYKGR